MGAFALNRPAIGSLVKTGKKSGCNSVVMGHVCDADPLPWMSHYAFRQPVENSATDQIRGIDQVVDPRIGWETTVTLGCPVDVLVQDAGIDDGVDCDPDTRDLNQERAAVATLASDFGDIREIEGRHRNLGLRSRLSRPLTGPGSAMGGAVEKTRTSPGLKGTFPAARF